MIKEMSELIYKEESYRALKQSINYATMWLYRSGIIGFCGKVIECNLLDIRPNACLYFRNQGVSRYFLKKGDIRGAAAKDISMKISFIWIC